MLSLTEEENESQGRRVDFLKYTAGPELLLETSSPPLYHLAARPPLLHDDSHFTESFLCARCFTHGISLKLHNNPMRWALLLTYYPTS